MSDKENPECPYCHCKGIKTPDIECPCACHNYQQVKEPMDMDKPITATEVEELLKNPFSKEFHQRFAPRLYEDLILKGGTVSIRTERDALFLLIEQTAAQLESLARIESKLKNGPDDFLWGCGEVKSLALTILQHALYRLSDPVVK